MLLYTYRYNNRYEDLQNKISIEKGVRQEDTM